MKPSLASRLDQRVLLEAPTAQGVGHYGQEKDEYAPVAEVWAEVLPVGGRDLWYAGQPTSEATHKVTIRQHDGLTPRWRVRWQGRALNIESVQQPKGARQDETVLMCVEQVGA